PVWLQQGQVSALLPRRPSPAYVRSFVPGFPGQPVFLVPPGNALPRGYAGLGLRPVDRITYVMPVWEETYERRPSSAQGVPLRLSIWRGRGGHAPGRPPPPPPRRGGPRGPPRPGAARARPPARPRVAAPGQPQPAPPRPGPGRGL